MDIRINRTQYIRLPRPGRSMNPGPSSLKSSALPIELTWQTNNLAEVYLLTTINSPYIYIYLYIDIDILSTMFFFS